MKRLGFLIIFLISVIAFFLRIFYLPSIPYGFHVDEVRAGYNAYSLLQTGRDENGILFPLFYNSFNENRPTGHFYLTIPFVAFFGLSEFSTRLPEAIIGTLTVIVFYFLVLKVSCNRKVSLLSAFFLSFLPWHILLSRATSEAVGSLFFTFLGLLVLFIWNDNKKLLYLFFSFIFFITSVLFYPSARITIPILLFLLVIPRVNIVNDKKILGAFFIIFSVISFVGISFLAGNNSRFSQVAFYKNPTLTQTATGLAFGEGNNKVLYARIYYNKAVLYSQELINNILSYLSPEFLVFGETKPIRYGFTLSHLLLYSYFVFLVVGLFSYKKYKGSLFFLLFLLAGIIPAALTFEDSPNMQRSILMIPSIVFFIAIGLMEVYKLIRFKKVVAAFIAIIIVLELSLFLRLYFVQQKGYKSFVRNEQSTNLSNKLLSLQNKYDAIVVTNTPDNLYIYLLFTKPYDPHLLPILLKDKNKREWGFENFIFTPLTCPSIEYKENIQGNILFVDGGDCTDKDYMDNVIEEMSYTDGSKAYNLVEKIVH